MSLSKGKWTRLATGLKQEGRTRQSLLCSLYKKPDNLNDWEQFLKKTLTELQEFVRERNSALVAAVISILPKTVRRGRHVELARSNTPHRYQTMIGRRRSVTTVRINLELYLLLSATQQPSVTSRNLEMYVSTWVHCQFVGFTRVAQRRKFKFMPR